MYAREVQGETITFGVSGKLIMNVLVMYDHQTRTLWSQFLGQGVKGPQSGVKLDFIPVTHTQWSSWLEAFPDTLVLDKGGWYRSDVYDSYYRGGSAGVLGESTSDGRLDRKALVVGVDAGGHTKAYPIELLKLHAVVNDSIAGQEVVLFMDGATGTALAYDRRVDDQTLTFEQYKLGPGAQAVFVDRETGSKWMAMSGRAFEGPLTGKTLSRALSHLSFWFAWKDWNPDTEVYDLPSRLPAGT